MSFEDMLKKLKTEYITNLPSKVDELKFLAEKKDFKELENFFHKLKGSGKSYGVSEATVYGEYFENILKSSGSLSDEKLEASIRLLENIVSARAEDKEYDMHSCEIFKNLKAA